MVATAGAPQQVEFLVDGKSRQIVKTPPFSFDWDAAQETSGQHKVELRGVDATGATANKQFTLSVLAAAAPVAAATPVAAVPNPTSDALLLVAAAILVLALAGAGIYFLFLIRKSSSPAPAPVVVAAPVIAAPAAPVEEKTEFIGRVPLSELTMMSDRRHAQVLPKAKLLVKPDRDIQLSRSTETVIGRDAANVGYVDDRQVSRQHARITCVNGEFWVEDLKSTNGTRLNGATVERHKLSDNDQISVGDTIMTFSLDPA